MKTLKLNVAEENILSNKEKGAIVGGNTCGCACAYRNAGGSSIADNAEANHAGNLVSKGERLQDCERIIIDGEVW